MLLRTNVTQIFSYHELGYYDLAAKVNYILSVTRQEQLYYFGHSQGSTTFFVLNSMRPEYNQRFKFMVALAPGVLLPHSKSLLLRALSLSDTLDVRFRRTDVINIFKWKFLELDFENRCQRSASFESVLVFGENRLSNKGCSTDSV